MNNKTKELSFIALFPALMAATAGITIPLFGLPPITLQTLFVFLAGLLLSPKNAFTSMCVYLFIGAIGIPVFSGYTSGTAVLFGPSGGFLMGFPIVARMISLLIRGPFNRKKISSVIMVTILGIISLYMIGGTYIALLYKINVWGVLSGFALYLPGDILKLVVAASLYMKVESFVTYEAS